MLVMIAPLIFATSIHAATPFSIEDIGGGVGLGTTDLKNSVVNAMSWVLGVLALVALFFLTAGFINLVGSGDSEVVKTRARRMIFGALIGLVVVLLAWAIVIFVVGTARNVTA
jgi:hypothetical protein